MITYAERACFREPHLSLLTRMETYEREHKLDVVDGKCGPIEHSWLRFGDGVILDPYAPGRMPAVQMIDPLVGAAYRLGTPRSDIQQAIVDRLVLEMRGDG